MKVSLGGALGARARSIAQTETGSSANTLPSPEINREHLKKLFM